MKDNNQDDYVDVGFPLQWPAHWHRCISPRKAIFKTTFARARDFLLYELRMMGATYPVISSNLMLRRDGLPYANQPEPGDSGVAVYFQYNGSQQCIPCDKWTKVTDNLQAIRKTVEALRGLERWGAKDMVDAAFQGFKALPAPDDVMTPSIQYFGDCVSADDVRQRYRYYAKEFHPDLGGSVEEFHEMQRQYKIAISRFEK